MFVALWSSEQEWVGVGRRRGVGGDKESESQGSQDSENMSTSPKQTVSGWRQLPNPMCKNNK